MRFDLFPNIKAKQGVPCTLEALAELVNSDTYIQAVQELQAAQNEDEERAVKNKLPVVTYNASFDGRERKNANAIPSGLFFSDYDGIDDPRKVFNEKICGHCDALGILRVEVSIRQHGLHLITECREGLKSIAEHQRWLDGQLGMQCDKACKDLARASYVVPESFVLYERGRLWNGEPVAVVPNPFVETRHGASPKNASSETSDETCHGASLPMGASDREATIARLESIPYNPDEMFGDLRYADILRQFWKSELGREEPLKGERHASLMEWARQVCYFTDFDLELMKRVTPTLGVSEHELAEIIYDTLRWRDEHKSPVTPGKLRGIVRGMEVAQRAMCAETRHDTSLHNDDSPSTADVVEDEEEGDWTDDEFVDRLPKKLPIGLADSLKGLPKKSIMPVVAGLMPMAMAYATDAVVKYCDGKDMRLNCMSVIYGDQASGKSAVKDVVQVWMEPMMDDDAEARKREDEFKQLKKNRKANEKLPEEPHEVIRNVPITISCSTMLKRLKNAVGMHLYSFGEELDTLRKTNGAGSWSSKYDLYRLSFDNGWWGQDYNSDQAESGMVRVNYNFTVLGTKGAVRKCFCNDNVENGLGGRMLFSKMPSKKFEYMPTYQDMKSSNKTNIQKAVRILEQTHGTVDVPKLRSTMTKWCNAKADEARADKDEVVDTFRKRAAVIGFRCGVVYHLLASEGSLKKLQKEQKDSLDFAVLMAEYALKYQCELFGQQIIDNQVGMDDGYKSRNKELFNKLPKEFTIDSIRSCRPTMKLNTIRQMIYRWTRDGYAVNVGRNTWKKKTT